MDLLSFTDAPTELQKSRLQEFGFVLLSDVLGSGWSLQRRNLKMQIRVRISEAETTPFAKLDVFKVV